MTTNSQLSTTESKETETKTKLSKQPEQEQNHRCGNHLEGYWLRRGKGENGRREIKKQGLRSIIGRYKIDKGMLRITQEMENLNV